MEHLYIYMGKQLLVAAILMGYYWLMLRNTRFHYYNRFYLVAAFLLSLVLPLIDVDFYAVEPPQNYTAQQLIYFLDQPGQVVLTKKVFPWEQVGLYAVLTVSLVLLCLMTLGVLRIYQLKKKSKITSMEGIDFIETNAEEAPFSFFKNLFWRKDISLEEVTGKNMLRHELTHIREKHTHDKLFVSVFTNICWVNPIFWLLRKELSIIHEFIADEKSVEQADASALAAMLLRTYDHHPGLLHAGQSFFYSSIKRRLNMLTSSKKTSYSYLRRILILPVALGMLFLLSFTMAKKSVNDISVTQTEKSITNTVSGSSLNHVLISDTFPAPNKNKEYRVKTVGDSLIFLDAKTGKFLFKLPQTAIAPPPPPPLTFRQIPKNAKILFVVDGVPMTQEEVNKIPPTSIETINVRKGKEMESLYGEKAKDGALLITTIAGKKLAKDTVITVVGRPMHKSSSDAGQDKAITVVGHRLSEGDDPKTRVIVTFDKEIAMIALEKDSGVSISVSNENGKNKYTIRKPVVKEQSLPDGLLYIVNGKRMSQEEFKTIGVEKIKSINVLKGKSATDKYGADGEKGVLEIELK